MRIFLVKYSSGRESSYPVKDEDVPKEVACLRKEIESGLVKSYDHHRAKENRSNGQLDGR